MENISITKSVLCLCVGIHCYQCLVSSTKIKLSCWFAAQTSQCLLSLAYRIGFQFWFWFFNRAVSGLPWNIKISGNEKSVFCMTAAGDTWLEPVSVSINPSGPCPPQSNLSPLGLWGCPGSARGSTRERCDQRFGEQGGEEVPGAGFTGLGRRPSFPSWGVRPKAQLPLAQHREGSGLRASCRPSISK